MKTVRILSKGLKFLMDRNYRTLYLAEKGFYNRLSDEEFLKLIFGLIMKESLDLDNPQTFN